MDTGKIKHDYTYYEECFRDECDPEVILQRGDLISHIWIGYFVGIFSHPPLHGLGWTGFTRDYQQGERTFADNLEAPIPIDCQEYLDDLKSYRGKEHTVDGSEAVLEYLIDFLTEAIKTGREVRVMYDN